MIMKLSEAEGSELVVQLLKENKNAIHPGRGKQNAELVRKLCIALGLDEDEFLPKHIVRNKRKWMKES